MTFCPLTRDGDRWRCPTCHRQVRATGDAPPSAVCGRGRGIGDLVAAGLASAGITEERVSAVIGHPCWCPAAHELLNAAGRVVGIGEPTP
jgi:hypothetical protein